MTYQYSHGLGLFTPFIENQTGLELERINIYSSNQMVGIAQPAPRYALDVKGDVYGDKMLSSNVAINSVDTSTYNLNVVGTANISGAITGPTITAINTTTTFNSNAAVFASNLARGNSNYLYPSMLFTSNAAVATSNLAYLLSNQTYGPITTSITTAQTAATFGSNVANFASNLSVGTSNNSFALSNYVYSTIKPLGDFGSNTSVFASNVAVFGSNTAVYSSNNMYLKTGGTISGNMTVNGTTTLSGVTTLNNNLVLNNSSAGSSNVVRSAYSQLYLEGEYGCTINTDWNGNNGFAPVIIGSGSTTFTEVARFAATTGNLGIGTSTPNEKLHVEGKIYASQQFLGDSNDTSTNPAYSFRQDPNSGMYHIAEDTLGFGTAGTERLRVNASGITSAQTILAPSYSIVTNSSSGGDNKIRFSRYNTNTANSDGSGGLFIQDIQYIAATNALYFEANDATAIAISSNAQIGIKTTTPTFDLDINGITRFGGDTYVNSATEHLMLMDSAGYALIGGASNSFQNAASLAINGRSKAGGGALGLIACDNGYINFSTVDAAGTGTEHMRIAANGRLGVKTINPQSELDVNGSIRSINLVASSNISSKAWTLGPSMVLQWGYQDLTTGPLTYSLSCEPGNNKSENASMFNGNGFLNGTDASAESLAWNKARLIIRGCRQGTNLTAGTCTADIRVFTKDAQSVGSWTTLCTFDVTDNGSLLGYCTNVSPWFTLPTNKKNAVIGVRIATPVSVVYRLGPTYISFAA